MPRKKPAMIGARVKMSQFKRKLTNRNIALSVLHDHVYSSKQHCVLGEDSQRDMLWSTAWRSFFIGLCEEEHHDLPCQQDQAAVIQDSDGFIADQFYVVLNRVYEYNPADNLDHIVTRIFSHLQYEPFLTLKKNLVDSASELGDFILEHNNPKKINFLQLYDQDVAALKLSVTIAPSFRATVHVHRRKLDDDHDLWTGLPNVFLTVEDVKKLLSRLSRFKVCAGNYDDKFAHFIPVGTISSEIAAYREGDFGATINGTPYTSTIRSFDCHFLTRSASSRCSACGLYRGTLRSISRRQSLPPKPGKQNTFTQKTHRAMTKDELIHKFDMMKDQRNSVLSELQRLKRSIKRSFAQKEDVQNLETTSDFEKLFREYSQEIKN